MFKKLYLLPMLVLSLAISNVTLANPYGDGPCNCPGMQMKGECKCDGERPGMGCHCKRMFMKKTMESLNLSDTQKKEIQAIRADTRNQLQPIYKQMREVSIEMRGLVRSDKIDDAKLNALIDKKKELFAQKLKIKMQAKNKMYNVLTSAQKNQFNDMMTKKAQMLKERMKKMLPAKGGMVDGVQNNQ